MNLAELFRHQTDLKVLAPGEALFREGDTTAQLMYVLMSGEAEISVRGKRVEVAGKGAILGEMAMIDDAPRSATVVAQTECRVLPIERQRFNFLIQQTPNFAVHVMRVLADRLRRVDARL